MQGNIIIDRAIGGIFDRNKDVSKETGRNLLTPTKGQRVTGVVTATGKEASLNIQGQEVKVSSENLQSYVIGEIIDFEIHEINDKTILLKVLEYDNDKKKEESHQIKPGTKKNQDQDSYIDKKNRSTKKNEYFKETALTNGYINDIVSMMTEKDYEAIEAEGIAIDNLTMEGLKHALDRIKSKKQSNSQENHSLGDMDSSIPYGNMDMQALIINKLNEANLPVTKEAVQDINTALSMVGVVTEINDMTVKYLMHNKLDPTIGNIYKSQYSSRTMEADIVTALPDDTWEDLQTQVEENIVSAGYEVNEERLNEARWLIENNLPLTKESFDYLRDIDEVQSHSDKEAVLDRLVSGMQRGLDPRDVPLSDKEPIPYERMMEDISQIEDQTYEQATSRGEEVSIDRLVELQKNASSNTDGEVTRELNIDAVKAKRELEEIRLKMTREALYKMRSKGFTVETESLEMVVEELRKIEEEYYKDLFRESNIDMIEAPVQLLKDTFGSIERFRLTPSYVLGATITTRKEQTISTIIENGTQIRVNLDKARESYETLMTVPSSEYGDSIQKAFRNMESIIQELGIENTETNQRAIKILGYNQIEITKESIQHVKMYDHQVQKLINNLTPSVAVHLIKENIDPLNIPIYELNPMIEEIKEDIGVTKEEKYSTFLWKMDKDASITDSDRKAYIDIYRLLYQISQKDGAALGSVIKANQDITLQHLMTAVKTYKKGSMDVKVDETFGLLESEQAEYQNSIINTLTDTISADNLTEATKNIMAHQHLIEKESAVSKEQSSDAVWEAIKDIPLDQLLEEISHMKVNDKAKSEVYTEKMLELRDLLKKSDQAVQFLNDMKMPSTSTNIQIANMILSNENSIIKKLKGLSPEKTEENLPLYLKETEELTDNLIDKENMNKAYDQLEVQVNDILEREYQSEVITSQKIAELKLIGQQMTFLKSLARKEFYQLPLDTDNGITNINLTIIRGVEQTGTVSIGIQSEHLGSIRAEFSIQDQMLKGFVSSDSRNGLKALQDNIKDLEKASGLDDITVGQIDFGLKYSKTNANPYISPYTTQDIIETESNTMDHQTEKDLYSLAKTFIHKLREIERVFKK